MSFFSMALSVGHLGLPRDNGDECRGVGGALWTLGVPNFELMRLEIF